MGTVAVTGANGFIGKNLMVRLGEVGLDARAIAHDLSLEDLADQLSGVGLVIHLAGVNRPQSEEEFISGNQGMTEQLVAALTALGGQIPLAYASSIQADRDNAYGRSKKAAENAVAAYGAATGAPVKIFRLPNVFGKWCRPNYNSVVATFCHNISRGLPITISDASAMLRLVYVDDVVQRFVELAQDPSGTADAAPVAPEYAISLGELANRIEGFRDSRENLVTGAVGTGLMRALHATYVSYLEPKNFDYPLVAHEDPRGRFVEMLRTPDSGQFSYFTAHPGITRGGHYHHSKTEKFLVVQGMARFGFRHILTNETFEIVTSGAEPRVVETVPGWAHDVTNIGDDTMVVMLWANELFDREKPDTIAAKVLTP
jgi:UDP-2-acetamido-2,6-beta-L-arabino-hexul-4-ose reductase